MVVVVAQPATGKRKLAFVSGSADDNSPDRTAHVQNKTTEASTHSVFTKNGANKGVYDVMVGNEAISIHLDVTGEREVSTEVWGAAFVLSAWLQNQPQLIKDKDVLELGSGTGIAGISLSRHAKRMVTHDCFLFVVSFGIFLIVTPHNDPLR